MSDSDPDSGLSVAEPIPLIARAHGHGQSTALIDDGGRIGYDELLGRSADAASALLAGDADLAGARVAFLTPPGIDYVVAQWGIWRAGGIAVPLCTSHPAPELEYVIDDAGARIVVTHPMFASLLTPLAERRGIRVLSTTALQGSAPFSTSGTAPALRGGALISGTAPALRGGALTLPRVAPERGAMLLYTSGTTGKPKGVLCTHAILAAQIESIIGAWEWTAHDHVLHVLPLHHLHGVLNVLCCALWAGARCEFLPRFDPERVWAAIADRSELTLFMAVPTIYARLTQSWEQASPERRAQISTGCRRLRLMVSGSAALPVAVLERFRAISGHTLLERYGMTEFGMGLGNPLHGERKPGHVGVPFPDVRVRLCDERGVLVRDGEPGEIQIAGPGVFQEYWQKPAATREAFTADAWFKTGDVAVYEHGAYRILGRESVDILKTGGYKVSALEIEEALREHAAIRECAVVGVPDEAWGQRVAALVVLHEDAALDLEALRAWAKQRLAPYKVPSLLRVLSELPRNAMGKVQKPELVRLFAPTNP